MEISFPPSFLETIRARYGLRPTRDAAMSTSVRGIGPLQRDRIVAQAEKGLQVIGVTFLYETTWIQSWFEWGQLHLEKRTVAPYLREVLKDSGIKLHVPLFDGTMVDVKVWQQEFGKAQVYFLDASPLRTSSIPAKRMLRTRQPNPMSGPLNFNFDKTGWWEEGHLLF
jgi:hypothetical protein